MGFISSAIVWFLESALGQALLKLVWDDLSGWLTDYVAKKKAQKANVGAAQASVQPLKDAKDGKAIDDASDSALNGT